MSDEGTGAVIGLIAIALTCWWHFTTPKPPSVSQCFGVANDKDIMPIMFNECTGESWMLAKVVLVDEKGEKDGSFTYRWTPVTGMPSEAELTLPVLTR